MSPQGDKSAYMSKQKRPARTIKKSVKSRAGRSTRTRNAAGRFIKARKTAKRTTRKTAARKTVRKTIGRKVGGYKGAKRANRSKRTVATQRNRPERTYERKEHLNPMQKIMSVFR